MTSSTSSKRTTRIAEAKEQTYMLKDSSSVIEAPIQAGVPEVADRLTLATLDIQKIGRPASQG